MITYRLRKRIFNALATLLGLPAPTWPDGHFYSPVLGQEDVERALGSRGVVDLTGQGLRWNGEAQLALAGDLLTRYPPDWAEASGTAGCFTPDNPSFSWGDAAVAQAIIRAVRPRRVVEVGIGQSTCLMVDTVLALGQPEVALQAIDPYPPDDPAFRMALQRGKVELLQCPVQHVALQTFESLAPGDILFVDSSHVSKAGSDVNWILFNILPRLADGVLIHFHDIFFPFDYPEAWIRQRRSWNEAYLLKAFLQYNDAFQVLLMNDYVGHHSAQLEPSARASHARNPGGSVWLAKGRNLPMLRSVQDLVTLLRPDSRPPAS